MAHPVAVTDGTFQTEVLEADTPVLVDFWAEWCQPCKMIAPHLEKIATEQEGKLKIAKVNVDENPRMMSEFRIRGIPTLILFKGGRAGRDARRVHGREADPGQGREAHRRLRQPIFGDHAHARATRLMMARAFSLVLCRP